jgi:hypothetical protein
MLVFVMPLKSQKASKSWQRVTQLFERSLKSACNQTSSNFHVIVVCHEKPEIDFQHPNVTYVPVDFLPAKAKNSTVTGAIDKGRKLLKGVALARQFSPTHIMPIDADDCVSQKLAEFVEKNPTSHGWVVNKGYKYQEGSQHIYIKRRNFYQMCGTCNIIRYDLTYLPENPEYDRDYGYYKFYIEHGKAKASLSEQSVFLKSLPFPGAVYILETGEHLFYNSTRLNFSIFNRKKLNQAIENEFGLHKLQERQLIYQS